MLRPSCLPNLTNLFAATTSALLLSACVQSAGSAPEGGPVVVAEEPVAIELAAPVSARPEDVPTRGAYAGAARRGVLTAGDIDDRLNLAAFGRYLHGTRLGLPQLGLGAPLVLQVTGPRGEPAPGARYTLRRPGAAEAFHEGYVGPDGRIVDYPNLLGGGNLAKIEIRVFGDDGQELARQTLPTGRAARLSLPQAQGWQPDFLDLVLVVDTTGSMGDEIAFLRKELIGITRAAARKAPGVSIRYGLVAYRDRGDAYVVKTYGFTGDSGTMAGWLRGLSADGGGDYPEAAAAALRAGVAMNWRRGKGERLVLHVADAPAHPGEAADYLRAAKAAAEEGVQVFTLGASGVAAESEYLMRQASVATGGRYLFLTDDSGVGNAHGEPTIPCYQVVKLTQLLGRVLATELSGIRQESGGALREVGSYARGVCRD